MTAIPRSLSAARRPVRPGTVALVGAGPGDPELITVRGHRLLAAADVVVYDRLVGPALLEIAPPSAERIFVGKAAGLETLGQRDIERTLIDRARRGLTVVRLKGGDPFVFGRGGEEALALARADVPYEIVPAVSSALGVPARASIPVTHRGVAASFAVITAHRIGGRDDHDWAALARVDTLVVLMGVASLERVASALLEHGRGPETPSAIIERGTRSDERVTITTLGALAARARRDGVRPPATIVIGAVVEVRRALLESARRAREAVHAQGLEDVEIPLGDRESRDPESIQSGGYAHVR